MFQPTRPVRGVTPCDICQRPNAGFQPTRPVRGVTYQDFYRKTSYEFQPTRPVRGVTTGTRDNIITKYVSTHTPRTGRDKILYNVCV